MFLSSSNLLEFEQNIKNASKDKEAEITLRLILESMARYCSIEFLLDLSRFVADCRRKEMQEESESN